MFNFLDKFNPEIPKIILYWELLKADMQPHMHSHAHIPVATGKKLKQNTTNLIPSALGGWAITAMFIMNSQNPSNLHGAHGVELPIPER